MAGSPTETVLVIDDDAAKRHSIVKILRKAGYAIREGETGSDALRLAAEKPILIILDVKLPDMSGFEVCRRIKEDAATAAIPVLHISTTFVDIEDRIQGLEGGADGYLTDVLEPLELIATVKALLRARRAEEAAQISSRQWQVTFDAISDGVVLLEHQGRVIQANAAISNRRRSCGCSRPASVRPSNRLPATAGSGSPSTRSATPAEWSRGLSASLPTSPTGGGSRRS
jgi:DNA-binding response OmpR family regulator